MNCKQKLFQRLHRAFRICPICGSSWTSDFLTCEYCWDRLLQDAKSCISRNQGSIPVKSLWTWVRDQNRAQSILLHCLKSHHDDRDWEVLARLISEKILAQGTTRPQIFIPCPARTNEGRDHAWHLAKALSDFWQRPLILGLENRAGTEAQKEKSRTERAQICFRLNENFSQNSIVFEGAVFVDDVVTTGATAQAAYEALGRPRGFEVWCLAHRHLAASRGSLL